MIYDVHRYSCRYGALDQHLALYEELGRAAKERHLGAPVVCGTGETGDLESFTHIWAYDDMADRQRRRAAMAADPDWQAYLKASRKAGHLVSRRSYILRAVVVP